MFLFIVIVTLVQVFFRYVLNDALSWSAELTRIIFVWMTFLCSAVAVNRMRHMRVDTFINLLPAKARLLLDIFVHVLLAIFMVVLTVKGFEMVDKTSRILTGALRWPRSVFFLPLVLGGGFMFVFCVRIVVDDCVSLFGRKTERKE
ncbi:MAG: TRAP transporter small permease [Desulfopila sp.]